MAELNLKDLLPRVKAPENFEEKVIEKIRARKERKRRYFLIIFKIFPRPAIMVTSALMVLLILGIIFLPPIFRQHEEPRIAVSSAPNQFEALESSILSLIEPVDFQRDFADTPAKRVVYILEAVNENFIPEVKY